MTTDPKTVQRAVVTTPIGELLLVAQAGALREIRLPDAAPDVSHDTKSEATASGLRDADDPRPRSQAASGAAVPPAADALLEEAARQLDEYLAGERREFDLPLRPAGTAFQRRVWLALRSVGYGETVTYGQLARTIGRPKAARAVGAALAGNPLPLVLPCHRVIGAGGELRGFAGGIALKRYLLGTEAARSEAGRRTPRRACVPAVETTRDRT
jgi:methylated-DNA-[protein]-cysteine S-methyltransferase